MGLGASQLAAKVLFPVKQSTDATIDYTTHRSPLSNILYTGVENDLANSATPALHTQRTGPRSLGAAYALIAVRGVVPKQSKAKLEQS